MCNRSVHPLLGVLFALALLANGGGARADDRYELEFRSRETEYFGHNYVVLRHWRDGVVVERRLSGFGPAPGTSDLDAVLGAPGFIGVEPGDRSATATRRLIVPVGGVTYARVTAFVIGMGYRPPVFSVVGYNCNAYLGEVAHVAGLAVPAVTTQLPADYIVELSALNRPRLASAH
jgi:hypothetical protein